MEEKPFFWFSFNQCSEKEGKDLLKDIDGSSHIYLDSYTQHALLLLLFFFYKHI